MQKITLQALLDLFLFKWKWLVLGLVIGGLLMSAYTVFLTEEQYTATVSMYVQNTENETGVATTSNLTASRMLTNSCAVILSDVQTIKTAASVMTEPATLGTISRALSISTTEDSAIITVRATTNDRELSQSICQAICDIAPEMLLDVAGAGSIKALGDVPEAVKTGPNLPRNVVVGAAGGLVVVGLIVLIRYLTDTTVHHKEDLRYVTDLPLLGEIPTLSL